MNQNFSLMEKLKSKLLDGTKTRTNRKLTEFRDKCDIGDIMHIFVNLRSPNCEKIFDRVVKETYYWDITEVPKTVLEAKNKESPRPDESWYQFAIRDGFSTYREFLDYFMNHPKKGIRFKCYIWKNDIKNQRKLSEYLEG